jgi:agmatine/peptidylarginine deiminase
VSSGVRDSKNGENAEKRLGITLHAGTQGKIMSICQCLLKKERKDTMRQTDENAELHKTPETTITQQQEGKEE